MWLFGESFKTKIDRIENEILPSLIGKKETNKQELSKEVQDSLNTLTNDLKKPNANWINVEKNLFIISNYLVDKIKDISLITISNSFKHKFNKKIRFISLEGDFWDKIGRRKKFFLSLFILFLKIIILSKILLFYE